LHKLYNLWLYGQNYCKNNTSQEKYFGTWVWVAF
jgi:hypothetical protein